LSTVYIYFDESGDLGFDFSKRGTSRWFIVTFLVCANKRLVEKVVSKTFLALPSKVRKRHSGSLHAVSEKSLTRKRMLALLSGKDIQIMALRIDKGKIALPSDYRESILYAGLVQMLLRECIHLVSDDFDSIVFIASRKETNRANKEHFIKTLQAVGTTRDVAIEVVVVPHAFEKGLQAVDFVSWSIFQKYERGDSSYVDLLGDKIIFDEEADKTPPTLSLNLRKGS